MRKALSFALALVMSLGLTVPAFAADTLTGSQLYPNDWGSGPSVTLTGVVRGVETQIDPSYLYDVEVGGSLVLEMTYPAGKNRSYSIMIGGFYITPDFNPPDDNDTAAWDALGESWDLSGSIQGGDFDESSGKTRFVYTFTESDMGQKNGLDKIIYPHIYWCDDANRDGMVDEGSDGSAYFGVRVVPAQSVIPTTPPAAGNATASPTNDKLEVNGAAADPTVYKINGSNYFKIRDVAALLNGTEKQFAVGYDGAKNAVTATTGQGYEKQPGDLAGAPSGGEQSAAVSNDAIYVNGEKITAEVYKIGGSNYFKLRDLGKALNFYVGWSAQRGIYIETDKPYSE